MNSKTTLTMVIALVAMIGMTGLAVADSTMVYDVDFAAVGTGSVLIQTISPVGNDVQSATWTNCAAVGDQQGVYNNGDWLSVDRDTSITGVENGNVAYGSVVTSSYPTTPVSDVTKAAVIQTTATYYDNAAYGSNVQLIQNTDLYDGDMPTVDNNGVETANVVTQIDGYAYGNATTGVTGQVISQTDGSLTAKTGITATVHDGALDMDVTSRITDDASDDETSRTTYIIAVNSPADTSDGIISGFSMVNGVPLEEMIVTYTNADVNANGYFYAVTI